MFGKWSNLFDLSKKKDIFIINPSYCSFQTSLSLKSAINPIQSAFSLVKLTIFLWVSPFSLWFAPFSHGFPMVFLMLSPCCGSPYLEAAVQAPEPSKLSEKSENSERPRLWVMSLLVKIWPIIVCEWVWWDKNMGLIFGWYFFLDMMKWWDKDNMGL